MLNGELNSIAMDLEKFSDYRHERRLLSRREIETLKDEGRFVLEICWRGLCMRSDVVVE